MLRNTTTSPLTARPKFFPTGENTGNVIVLPQVTVPANGIKQLDLTSLVSAAQSRPDLDSVSVQIINNGASGSLVGAANFKNSVTGVEYDIPLRDSGQTRNSAGAYPIRLDDDYTTVLSITNVGGQPGKFTMQVNYDGGIYAMFPRQLAPGETAIFDFRKIRNQQIPDSSGRLLPVSFAKGQIKWGIVGGPTTQLIGRSEVISRNGDVSSSYSCGQCCPPSIWRGDILPSFSLISVGNTIQFQSIETDVDCYNNQYSPYPVSAFWASSNESVATVNSSNGMAYGVNSGATTFSSTWESTRWLAAINDFCIPETVTITEQADAEVPPCDYPVNFHQVGSGSDTGNGTLRFRYEWSSSNGILGDLSQCSVGEKVVYPGVGDYAPSSPPFNQSFRNPTIIDLPATDGALIDNHRTSGGFITPYSAASFTASQVYRYKCPCKNHGLAVDFGSSIDIVRTVSQIGQTSQYKFLITKSGSSATINPLP